MEGDPGSSRTPEHNLKKEHMSKGNRTMDFI